jgi:polar amino acid transport system substrate-binding protein
VLRLGTLLATVVVAILLGVGSAGALLVGCHMGSGNEAAGRFEPLQPDTLTVATTFPSAGFWEGGSVDDITGGFEYDLARELAGRFGLSNVDVVNIPFEDLVGGTASGFDLALAQISVTLQREEDVQLSDTYLGTPVGVVGRPGEEVDDLADARDLTWGVGEATTEVDVIEDRVRPHDDAEIFETTTEAVAAVAAGEIEAVAADFIRAVAEVAANPGELALVAQIDDPQYYAALLPKDSDNLEAVNSAIRALRTDGTLGRLRDELYDHFDVDVDAVPTIRVRD